MRGGHPPAQVGGGDASRLSSGVEITTTFCWLPKATPQANDGEDSGPYLIVFLGAQTRVYRILENDVCS